VFEEFVARGLASRLRLKYREKLTEEQGLRSRQGPGISSEIEMLKVVRFQFANSSRRQGPGISSEIEIILTAELATWQKASPGAWLLV